MSLRARILEGGNAIFDLVGPHVCLASHHVDELREQEPGQVVRFFDDAFQVAYSPDETEVTVVMGKVRVSMPASEWRQAIGVRDPGVYAG